MASGVRDITVRRGLDPRDFPIVVAGGAGPVHAAAIACELDIPVLITPRDSSIFCAAGMLVCDFKHDYVQSANDRLDALDLAALVGTWKTMAEEGRETLRGEGVGDDAITFEPSLDLRYKGQWYELNIPLDAGMLGTPDVAAIAEAFHAEHELLFGYHSDEMPIDVLNIRLSAVGRTSDERIDLSSEVAVDKPERPARREIWSPQRKAMVEVDVHQGTAMGPNTQISGPAVIELGTTTIVVLDQYDCVVDRSGSFVMYLRDRAEEIRARLNL